jgi:hypothetical protein
VVSVTFWGHSLIITHVSVESLTPVGFGHATDRDMRAVDNHILARVQKLETDPAQPVHFQNVSPPDYKFALWRS